MKLKIPFLAILLAIVACNSVKRSQVSLNRGDYDRSIALSVKKIQKDKTSPKADAHILLLEEAFGKAVEQDNRRISNLKRKDKLSSSRELYHTYLNMENRQNAIRPLLPLYSSSENRKAVFRIVDYGAKILSAKEAYAGHLYDEALRFMGRDNTMDYRNAYGLLWDLKEIDPAYPNLASLLDEAHYKGTDFVIVKLLNQSGQIIPQALERDLLDFNTYGLDDFWTEYHSKQQADIDYRYGISFVFKVIEVSPEHIFEKEVVLERRIADGWEYDRGRNGEILKDSLGNAIKTTKYINVNALLTVTEQSKSVLVGGELRCRDLSKNRDMEEYPLATEFVFENRFATYRGDERALSSEELALSRNRFVPFPSHAQMLMDAGVDIKLRFKGILEDNPFMRPKGQ